MALPSFLNHLINWRLVVWVRDSSYGMPVAQSVHLLGLTVLLATILVVDLRLAGVKMKDLPLTPLARQLKPWTIGAITLVVVSGILIFLTRPESYLHSNPFRIKMALLSLAILFHFGVVDRRAAVQTGSSLKLVNVFLAGLSLTLWFSVGWAGRAIAFIP